MKNKKIKLSDIKMPYMDCTNAVSADDIKFVETSDVPSRDVFKHGNYHLRPRKNQKNQKIILPLPLGKKNSFKKEV